MTGPINVSMRSIFVPRCFGTEHFSLFGCSHFSLQIINVQSVTSQGALHLHLLPRHRPRSFTWRQEQLSLILARLDVSVPIVNMRVAFSDVTY